MDRPDIVAARRHLLIGCLLFLVGWLVAGSFVGHWPMENTVRLGRWTWYLPVDLPRVLGVVWLLIWGLNALRIEAKWPGDDGDDLMGVGGLYFTTIAGLLIGLVVASIGRFTGSWLSLLAVGGLMFGLARDDPERSAESYVEMLLFVAAAIGVWTGFVNGLLHALVGIIVYVLTPAARSLAQPVAPSAAPSVPS